MQNLCIFFTACCYCRLSASPKKQRSCTLCRPTKSQLSVNKQCLPLHHFIKQKVSGQQHKKMHIQRRIAENHNSGHVEITYFL